MSEHLELKPARCGCGGEAVKVQHELFGCVFAWDIHCMKCGIETRMFDTEAEAIEAWNKAMSGHTRWSNLADVRPEGVYCNGCGARLTDWSPEGRSPEGRGKRK